MRIPVRGHTCRSLVLLVITAISGGPTALALAAPGAFRLVQHAREITANHTAQEYRDVRQLELGKQIERKLAGGQAHSYQIMLAANQYLHAVVEQRGIDVIATVFDPSGREIVTVNNSLSGAQAPELVLFITEAPGNYRLEVRPQNNNAGAGDYVVKVQELRAATEQDRSRVAADRSYMEGERLRLQATAESLQDAIHKYEEALSLWGALGDRHRQAQTLHSIGLVHGFIGDNNRAAEFYSRALSLSQAIRDLRGQGYALAEMGWCYYLLGERQKAFELYNEALALMRAAGEIAGEALTLNRIGAFYKDAKDYHKALRYHLLALPLMRSVSNRTGEAYTLAGIGWSYDFLREKAEALKYHLQALRVMEATDDRDGLAYVLSNVAYAYHSLGETDRALNYYRRALEVSESMGVRGGQSILRYNTARVHFDRGDFTAAQAQIEAALGIIESLRTHISSQELRASYFSTAQRYYEFYIDVLMSLHKQRPSEGFDAKALEASERARARSLLDLLTEARIDIRQGVDPRLIERERSLQHLLNTKDEAQRRLLSGNHAKEQAEEIAKQIETITAQYQQTQAQIREKSPGYAASDAAAAATPWRHSEGGARP